MNLFIESWRLKNFTQLDKKSLVKTEAGWFVIENQSSERTIELSVEA